MIATGAARLGDLRTTDRPHLAALLERAGVFRSDEIDVALSLFDEAEADGPDSGYHFVGAFAPNEQLVGYACYGPTPATDRTYDLYWIAVDPDAQGQGCGTALLNEVERRLVQENARLLIVETSTRTEYASTRRFYTTRGYGEAARVRAFYAPGDDRLIYTKRLSIRPQGRGATSS